MDSCSYLSLIARKPFSTSSGIEGGHFLCTQVTPCHRPSDNKYYFSTLMGETIGWFWFYMRGRMYSLEVLTSECEVALKECMRRAAECEVAFRERSWGMQSSIQEGFETRSLWIRKLWIFPTINYSEEPARSCSTEHFHCSWTMRLHAWYCIWKKRFIGST